MFLLNSFNCFPKLCFLNITNHLDHGSKETGNHVWKHRTKQITELCQEGRSHFFCDPSAVFTNGGWIETEVERSESFYVRDLVWKQ